MTLRRYRRKVRQDLTLTLANTCTRSGTLFYNGQEIGRASLSDSELKESIERNIERRIRRGEFQRTR